MIKLKGHHKSGLFGLGISEGDEPEGPLYGLGGPVLSQADMNIGQSYGQKGGSTASTGQPSTGSKYGKNLKKSSRRAKTPGGLTPKQIEAAAEAAAEAKAIKDETEKTLAGIQIAALKMCNWMNNKIIVEDMAKDYGILKEKADNAVLVYDKVGDWFSESGHALGKLKKGLPQIYKMIMFMRKSVNMKPSFGDYSKEPTAFYSHADGTPYKGFGGSNSMWWKAIAMPIVSGSQINTSVPKTMSIFWGVGEETEIANKPDWFMGGAWQFDPPGKLSGKVVKDNSLNAMSKRIKAWEDYYEAVKAMNPLVFPGKWPKWVVTARTQQSPLSWEQIRDTAANEAGANFKATVQKKSISLAKAGVQLASMKAEAEAKMDALSGENGSGNFTKWVKGEYLGVGAADFKLAMEAAQACHDGEMAIYAAKMAAKLAAEVKKAKDHIKQQNEYREGLKAQAEALQDQVKMLEEQQAKVLEGWDGKGDMPDKVYNEWETLNKEIEGLYKQIDAYKAEVTGLIEYLADKRTDLVLKRKTVVDAIKKAQKAKKNYEDSDPKNKDPETDAEMDGVDDSLAASKGEVEDAGETVIEIGNSMLDTMEKLDINMPDLILKIQENSAQAQQNIDDLNPQPQPKKGLPWLAIAAIGLGAAKAIPLTVAAVGAGAGLYLYSKATEE